MGTLRRFKSAFVLFLAFSTVIAALPESGLKADARPSPSLTPAPQAAVISLSVISASRAATTLRTLFPHDKVRVDRHANAIIAFGPPADIDQMRSIVQGIDVRDPQAPATEVVTLRALKPAGIVPRLKALYPRAHFEIASEDSLLLRASPQQITEIKAVIASLDVAPATPSPTARPADAVRIAQASPKSLARALEREIPHLRASVLGTSVILAGSQEDIDKAKVLAGQLDAPARTARFPKVYTLHNVDAASVSDLIMRSFPGIKVVVDKALNAISVLGTSAEQERIEAAVAELDANQTAGQNGAGPAYGDGNVDVIQLQDAMPGQNGAASTSAQDIANAVQQALSGMAPDLRLSVPANSSEIILAGSPSSIRLARDLISRLDAPQPLVVLDTQVLEVDENAARNIGLQLPGASISSTWQEIQPTPNPFTGEPGHIGRLQGLTRTPIQFTAELNLLVSKGNARVLADPRVTTISGHTATIRAGDTIAILTQTGGGVGTPVTQQLQTFQTGVTLDITPQVGPAGNVVVALHPVVNSLEGILNGVPQIATRDTQTVVQLNDNQTLVIGGLIQDTVQHSVSKIPLLGDIPFVGRLFQNSDTQESRNELVIVVTPHIIRTSAAPAALPSPLLPIPSEQPLPTLPPDAALPTGSVKSATVKAAPTSAPAVAPTAAPTATPRPLPTPTAFASTNQFVYGSPPPSTYAPPAGTPSIYYVQFSPTLLHNGSPVNISVVTSSNVQKVEVGYPGYMTTLTQVDASKWQASYNFNASGIVSSQQTVMLQVNAYAQNGTAATVQIPINLLSR